jgi:hypothetical protein
MLTTEAPPRPATPTQRKLAEMLIENTGAAMMDSGGIYGRAWQTTRAKYGLDGGLPNSTFHGGPGHAPVEPAQDDIERVALTMRDEPDQWIDKYGDYEQSTFHFLDRALDYDPALDAKYQRWQRVTNFGKDRWDRDWGLPLMDRFVEQLRSKGYRIGGIYGQGEPVSDNSYNHENAIDRTIQYVLFSVDSEDDEPFLPTGSYVLLQIHGGADVRGGYTDPVLFVESEEYGEYAILDYGRGHLRCDGNPSLIGQQKLGGGEVDAYEVQHGWDTENGGYTFNLDGMYGQGATVMCFDGYEPQDEKRIRAVYDEDREVWLCPIENCGAVLR